MNEEEERCDCCHGIRDTKHVMNGFKLCRLCYVADKDVVMNQIRENATRRIKERCIR